MNRIVKRTALALAAGAAVALPITVVLSQGSGRPGPAPVFTPVQLANGLAFNQGAVAPYLAAFVRPDAPLTGRMPAVERSVDAALRADPALALRFARSVQSGSTVRVAAALATLGRLTRAAFGAQFGRVGGRAIAAWAGETPKVVVITMTLGDPGGTCSTCVVNTPPPTVTGPPAPPPNPPPLPYPVPCYLCGNTPPPTAPAPPPSFTPPPPTCSTCVVNTPPPTVSSAMAVSLAYLFAEPRLAARADGPGMAETIAVVALSLDAH